jgi:hypothetical protein
MFTIYLADKSHVVQSPLALSTAVFQKTYLSEGLIMSENATSITLIRVPPSTERVDNSDELRFVRKDDDRIRKENGRFRNILEKKIGSSFIEKAEALFKLKGLHLDQNLFEKNLNDHLIEWRDYLWGIRDSIKIFKDRSNVEKLRDKKAIFRNIFEKSCTETYLEQSRIELSKWIDDVRQGRALFVDCPMGVGKTYSIAKVLADRTDLSAIIFMPTLKLCRKFIDEIKENLVSINPNVIDDYPGDYVKYPICDNEGNILIDDFGHSVKTYLPDFLEHEVYFVDGINKRECPYFNKIIKRYSLNLIKKKDICRKCVKGKECRFLTHDEKALKARIVITTHLQYDHFIKNEKLKLWAKDGNIKNPVPRDLFIIDEDIVFSKCYQPYSLSKNDLENFIPALSDFISEFEFSDDINQKLSLLLGQVGSCKTTSFFRPIDSEFSFSEDIKEVWKEVYPEINRIFPEDESEPILIGNHLDIIENGIKFGFVVQKYGKVNQVYFNNGRSYDLSNLPPHVFFDGTMLNERFLKHKLKGVEFKKIPIEVKSLWNFQVRQNTNTDITKKAVFKDQPFVQQLVVDLLKDLCSKNKYLFLSNKTTKSVYLEEFLRNNFSGYNYQTGYFFNLRGINDAQDCNVGIMLGSALPSDAVEIAMALEFIQDRLPENSKTKIENYFWVWEGSKGHRSYREEYQIIEELAKAYRLSEQRQAMARARYLFHDVDFYVLSKDRVSEYEPYAEVIDEAFREDLFQPRKERVDSKYEEAKGYILEWLDTHDTVKATEISDNHPIRRQTAGKYLKRMHEEGRLVKMSATKYAGLN